MKLAIDLGASNTKIVGVLGSELQYNTVRSCATLDSTDNNLVVNFNGRDVYFGVGEPLVRQDKTDREYIEETILLASYITYNPSNVDLDVALGLPLNLYKSTKKQDFQDKLNKLHGVTLRGAVNGDMVCIHINSITVFAEGYSAFVAIMPDITGFPALIVDHGYRTTDILAVSKDYNDRWIIEDYLTVDKGLYDVYTDISKSFIDERKVSLTPEQVEYRIEKAPMVPCENGRVNIREYIRYGDKVVNSIYNKIELKIPDVHTRDIYLLGGGANIINDILGDRLQNRVVLNDKNKQMYSNAVGYYLQL